MGMTTTQINVDRLDHNTRFTIVASSQMDLMDMISVPGVTLNSFKRLLRRHRVDTDYLSLEKIDGKQAYTLKWSMHSFITFELDK